MNGWGVRMEFPQDAPGPFPNNAEEYLVVKDIAKMARVCERTACSVAGRSLEILCGTGK